MEQRFVERRWRSDPRQCFQVDAVRVHSERCRVLKTSDLRRIKNVFPGSAVNHETFKEHQNKQLPAGAAESQVHTVTTTRGSLQTCIRPGGH